MEQSERNDCMYIKEPSKDTTGIHIYDHLEFPLMLYEKGDWDRTQRNYLNADVHTTESLIRWCRNHHIEYDILYPLKKLSPLKHPIRHIRYLKLIHTYN